MSFTSLGLHEQLVASAAAAGLPEPTPIQSQVIPAVLEGKDLLARTPGERGKVEAYLFPILQRLFASQQDGAVWAPPRALILSPTRKSVQDIQATALRYGKSVSLRVVGVFGGIDIDKQIRLLRRRTEMVVATPGRLLDHVSRASIDLSHIECLVIDDADKLSELGLLPDVRHIVETLPRERQTLLFTGMLNADIQALADGILHEPYKVDAGGIAQVDTVKRKRFLATRRESRIRTLLHLLESESMRRVIVLSRKDYEAERISRILKGKGIPSQTLRRSDSSTDREHAWSGIQDGSLRVLVGTEEAMGSVSRDGVSHLINFDFPEEDAPERTRLMARENSERGPAEIITFVTDEDRSSLHRIERATGQRISVTPYGGAGGRTNVRKRIETSTREGRKTMAEHEVKQFEKGTKPPKRRKKTSIVFARRKKPPKKLETFSSDHSGAGW